MEVGRALFTRDDLLRPLPGRGEAQRRREASQPVASLRRGEVRIVARRRRQAEGALDDLARGAAVAGAEEHLGQGQQRLEVVVLRVDDDVPVTERAF